MDGALRIWNAKTGKEMITLATLEDSDDWVAVAPSGLFDGSTKAWKKILWRFSNQLLDVLPVESFFNEFFWPGLLAEVVSGKSPAPPRGVNLFSLDRRLPKVKLESTIPSSSTGLTEPATVTVQIVITEEPNIELGVGVKDLRLFRNGTLVKAWRGDLLSGNGRTPCIKSGTGRTTCQARVTLAVGENYLTAYAFNRDNVKSEDAVLTVNNATSTKPESVLYIVAVGINHYKNSNFDLSFAVPDAEEFGRELKRQQLELNPQQTRRFTKVELVSILDSSASKRNILQALERLAGSDISPLPENHPFAKLRKANPEDAVILYFAGHGKAVKRSENDESRRGSFFLIPYDMGYTGPRIKLEGANLELVSRHSISDIELETFLEPVDAGLLLLVIDACNSGKAIDSEEWRQGPMNSMGLAQLAYDKGMFILTASQSYQVAIESSKFGHGFLTYALVEEGLKQVLADDAPVDGQVQLREWLDYATRSVPHLQSEFEASCRGTRADIQCPSEDKAQLTSDLVMQQLTQRPRVFYRREWSGRPFIVGVKPPPLH
jgi:hypothetical protein